MNWFDIIIREEGFESRDEYGGLTIFGIAENFWKDEKIFEEYRKGASRERLKELAKDFYYRNFFLVLQDVFKVSEKVGTYLLDTAVNIGISQALRLLNKATGKQGNKITNEILEIIKHKERIVLYKLHAERVMYYNIISQRDKYLSQFIWGWLNRSYRVLKEVDK